MLISSVCYRQSTTVAIVYLNIALSLAAHVNLYDTRSVGTVIFNVSHGDGWSYRWDPSTTSQVAVPFENWLTLDTSLGLVILKEFPTDVTCGAFSVHIEARTLRRLTNYTVTPLTIHLHGNKCPTNHDRKASIGFSRKSDSSETADDDDVHLIAIALNCSKQSCSNSISNIRQFLPATFIAGRDCSYRIRDSSSFQIGLRSGLLETTANGFMQNPYEAIEGWVSCFSTDTQSNNEMSFKIVLYRSNSEQISVLDYQLSLLSDSIGVRRRLRRDASNRPPTFEKNSYERNVPEAQPAGFVVDTIEATDADSGDAGSLTYSLLATRDGRSQSMFAVDAATGELTTTVELDRESMAKHYFQIIATDSGSPQLSGVASVTITVDDVNDNSPRFESPSYSQSVSESVSVGSTVVTVRANDADSGPNAEIQYSIVNRSGANRAFRIDTRRGSITTRSRLDRERHSSYRLTVRAVDTALIGGRNTASTLVTITVLDENDNRPQFTRASYSVDVREDVSPVRSPVIATVKAVDADAGRNAMVRYSIRSGNSHGIFAIDGLSGQISLRKPLDYDSVSSYRLSIRAQDSGSPRRSNSTNVLIRVIDVNDNAPKFFPTVYEKSVVEGVAIGHSILTVQAFDLDDGINAVLRYSLVNPPRGLPLCIDADTGTLTSSGLLDREKQAVYAFTVQAKDGGDPALSATASVQISLRDVNDNAPVFTPKVYNEVIAEEANLGTPVVVLTASDADEGENARISYVISSGNVRGAFNIISQMGQGVITVARELNYKEQRRYVLLVTASDTGNLIDTATVYVNVSDTNTHHPMFAGTPYQASVDENTVVGTVILTVVARDNDDGENARITYKMDASRVFQISPSSGEISVKSALDRESRAWYTFSITATDHGRPAKSDTTDVEVTVVDVNDNAPRFRQESYSGSISEDVLSGTSVLTVTATDIDADLNGRVRYTFEGGNSGDGDFTLDPTLGVLRTGKPLDRERVARYELVAFAVDRGTPELSTSVGVTIVVDDVNDNRPEFPTSRISLFVRENSAIGSAVGSVEATDPDAGVNARVEYSMVGGADAGAFRLQTKPSHAALITTATELDYEGPQTTYVIVVRARSFHLFSDATITIHVQDVNDNLPQLRDFNIVFNNFKNHFPTAPIGRVPAHDPDEYDELRYTFTRGNSAGLLHLDEHTGLISLDSRLNSDVPTDATLQVTVSGEYAILFMYVI